MIQKQMKIRVFSSVHWAAAAVLMSVLGAGSAGAAALYENTFAGSETGPSPLVTATKLTAPFSLAAGVDNPWVAGRIVQRPDGTGTRLYSLATGTYSAWFKVDALPAEPINLFCITGNAGNPAGAHNSIIVRLKNDGKIDAVKSNNTPAGATFTGVVAAGEWFHLAFEMLSFNPNGYVSTTAYLNGARIGNGAFWGDLNSPSATAVIIGSNDVSISNAQIDDTALTDNGIADLMKFRLIWNGTAGDSVWNTTSQNWLTPVGVPAVFSPGSDVDFASEGIKTVTLSDEVSAGSVKISESGYTFSGAGSLTAASLGSTIDASVAVPVKAPSLVAGANATLTLNTVAPLDQGTSIQVSGLGNVNVGILVGNAAINKLMTGTLKLTGNNSAYAGQINVSEGTVDLGNNTTNPKKVSLASAGTAKITLNTNAAAGILDGVTGTGVIAVEATTQVWAKLSPTAFTGTLRVLPVVTGSDSKFRIDRNSTYHSSVWFDIDAGGSLIFVDDKTANVRLAGDGPVDVGEKSAGALRLQGSISGQIELSDSATVVGANRTINSPVTVSQNSTVAPTLRLGIGQGYTGAINNALTLMGRVSGRTGAPLGIHVNACTVTLKGGASTDISNFTVSTRDIAALPAERVAQALLTGDTPQAYTFANVNVGGGKAGLAESLTVGANATLTVTNAITVTESDSAFIIDNGGTLAYGNGTVEGALTLRAGSILKPQAFGGLSAGSVALPASGSVTLDIAEELLPAVAGGKFYLLRTGSVTGGALSVFTGVPEKWFVRSDDQGIYLEKLTGLLISIY